jgi:hypothetical protein
MNRESIPWVKCTKPKSGEEYVYENPESPVNEQALDTLEKRVMDYDLYHHILAQGTADSMQVRNISGSLEFWHPNEDNAAWKDYLCSECRKDLYK